ncbi:MAG TPA: hypothetical protein DF712_21920 [Balneola sp.]|nr:hypothetical protein [Bacteroidota bacterium]HCI70469.1 hypothetical protein [Balneola sp.]HCT55114.1 hypothetical protein [Balneola sp.]|tara:strand:+ start:2579 stop:3103 length:525 start_codon:yes stop_codon:yes gene_type:complete
MKKLSFGIIIIFLISACSSKNENYLIKFYEGEFDEIGVPSGYLSSKGDTIIPIGKYFYCYTDTIRNFGMVIEQGTGKILGIDQNGTELYQVFNYDNGPDYVKSGLFRIIKQGKIGYADSNGKIVIQPRFNCAHPFKEDLAKVSDNCETIQDGEHSIWKSDNWYHITKNGIRVDK